MWETLEKIGDYYHNIYRALRNKYKWSPSEVDKLPLDRILRIFDETIEDHQKESIEEDFE